MRVRNRVIPPMALNNQQKGSGKAGANGSSQKMTLETLRRFQAAQKGKRAGKFKRGTGVAGDEDEMSDFDSALVGAYERLSVDPDEQQQQQHPRGDGDGDEANASEDESKSNDKAALPKFLPAHARRI